MKREEIKPFAWGMAVGAIVLLIVVFSAGWVVTSGTAKSEAKLMATNAVMDRLAPIAAQFIYFAVSRKREFLADANGAMLTRYPPGLASALRKISADREPLEAANKATAHLYIVNPLKDIRGPVNRLFSTHPPIEERIAALEKM